MSEKQDVIFLNPQTCGIYKNGRPRFKTDPATGKRTQEIDNELIDHVTSFLEGESPPGNTRASLAEVMKRQVLVPSYYDPRHIEPMHDFLKHRNLKGTTIGDLLDAGIISMRGGHGSPPNDQRTGQVPYIKVSDIRALRININPTNLVTEVIAQKFWKGTSSGLAAWDLVTPNRASSNIGEFAVLLPGEEQVVLTKEMFVFRVKEEGPWDPFYLLWALSLRQVREQWRRVVLMQTNREDCGERYREVVLPTPKSPTWARKVSAPFRTYFETLAKAKTTFVAETSADEFEYIPTVHQVLGAATDHTDEGDNPGQAGEVQGEQSGDD